MTESFKEVIPNTGIGILRPHMQHQFRFLFGGVEPEIAQQIAGETVSVELDYRRNTAHVVVQQPLAGGALHHFLWKYLKGAKRAYVLALDGNQKACISYVIVLGGMKCVKHKCRFDYANTTFVEHEMSFEFETLHMGDPEAEIWETNSES